MNEVFAFECTVKGTNWKRVVNARSAGSAKADYWRNLRDAWPDVPFTVVRVRKLGAPRNTERFQYTADYRGVSFKCGDRVRVGDSYGVIVDSNDSANFDVLFDDDAPRYPGMKLNVHPGSIQQ